MDVHSGKRDSAKKNHYSRPLDDQSRTSSRLTLLVLVDALRPDYVARAPYLRHLTASGATGVLRECFGFVPRAAYFGGLNAEQYGFTNMYCFDPAGSPFGLARTLPASPAGALVEAQAGVRQFLEQTARERMAPFARSYGSSAEIPLRFLPLFDLVEKRAPWEKQAGYRSLFALLDEKEIPWYQCSWPETNKLSDRSDEGIVRHVLEEMRPEHRFAYVHLQELDSIGHAFGPQSAEMQRHIAATDHRCQRLIETLRQRYDRLDLVLFGDHGMVNVTRTLDVWDALNATGLKFGIDYAFFLDSTMARLWFYHAGARERAQRALSALPGGRLLQSAELSHYGIAGCDSRNAEMIFLAEPGVLIFPNFFQGHGEPIKGMHGYDPDCPDNLGFFLLHSPDRPHLSGSNIGKVDPPELFPLLQELLGLTDRPANSTSIHTAPATVKGRFTAHPDPAADEMVRSQLDHITKAIEARFGQPKAVILTGSFGRGEGGVFRDATGCYRPVNDYDILVVDHRELGPELKKLGDELARELGVDYIDLGCSDGQWEQLPLSVMHYDLKYGSQVISGDPGVLDQIPAYAASDIAVWEAIKLLLNRSAGLLTGLRGEFLLGAELKPEARRYLTNQIAKALMAIGDWHLIRWECYDSSYRLRTERFRWLAPGAGVDAALAHKICQAYEFKCRPNYETFEDGLKAIAGFYPDLELALIQSINLHTESHTKNLSGAMTTYLECMSVDAAWVAADNGLCSAHPEIEPILKPDTSSRCSLRHLVYSVLPFLVTAASDPNRAKTAFAETVARLEPVFQLPNARAFSGAAWEDLRALVVKAWFAICH